MKPIKIPAIFDRYNRRKDRSYSLTFISDLEIGKEDRDAIDELWQSQGWLIFAPNELKEIEIPKEKAEVGQKTPSQRLYSRMYVAWKNRGIEIPFEIWRQSQLEAIGLQYLESTNEK